MADVPLDVWSWDGKGGIVGAFVVMFGSFLAAMKWLYDRKDLALDKIVLANKEANETLAEQFKNSMCEFGDKVNSGLLKVSEANDRREEAFRGLFDKHLEVTVKAMEEVGRMRAEVSDNTRQLVEVKHEVAGLVKDMHAFKSVGSTAKTA